MKYRISKSSKIIDNDNEKSINEINITSDEYRNGVIDTLKTIINLCKKEGKDSEGLIMILELLESQMLNAYSQNKT